MSTDTATTVHARIGRAVPVGYGVPVAGMAALVLILGRIQPGQQADLALWRTDPRSSESVEAAGLESVWVAGVAVKR